MHKQNHENVVRSMMDILGMQRPISKAPFHVNLEKSQFIAEKYHDKSPINNIMVIDSITDKKVMELILKHMKQDGSLVYFMYATIACKKCKGDGTLIINGEEKMCDECLGGSTHMIKFNDLDISLEKYNNLKNALDYE